MKAKRNVMLITVFFTVIFVFWKTPIKVSAAEATVTFGSNWYNKSSGDTFPIGVYLNARTVIGDYHIEIKYDCLRLQYVDGATGVDEENGILILEGNQNNRRIKFWLRFKAISGGEAFVEVSSAEVFQQNSADGELFTIEEYDNAPVHLKGEDTAAVIEARLEAEREREESGAGTGDAGQAGSAGTGDAGQTGGAGNGNEGQEEAGGAENIGQETGDAEPGNGGRSEEGNGIGDAEGDGNSREDSQREESGDTVDPADAYRPIKKEKRNYIFFNIYFVFTGVVVLLVAVVDVAAWNILKRVRRQGNGENEDTLSEPEDDGFENEFEYIDLDSPQERIKSSVPIMLCDDELEWRLGRPVIKVCDVTMEFKLSSINPSGLKEYLVQVLKREVSYRKLYALYHVSFNVYKGEVIGIIGTNGSGKSTLLKIVSGALKPTDGYVDTGRRKVQLLTLGTGFDVELTARENVFLNGAIIGYRKEFLEAHYDEIVEFAELQDFMEEKVKNFSSGMVSRLGFAIATAGDAAEILILDEILSVGDEFFRQKSLKRIKEMIHGGSTVLMVSHSMGTILEHCTRCVWIEKGELQMVGEPRAVCEEYRRMNEKG